MSDLLNKVLTPEAVAEDEWIAGVPRKVLFEGEYWTGFKKVDENEMFEIVSNHLEFRPRNEEVEKDESFKQIIPYFLVRKDNKYFTSVRKTKGGDVRMHGHRLIGFGGHLRKEDIVGKMSEWLKREFEEEIEADEIVEISFVGIVNDDSDAVSGIGRVHFGLVFVVDVEGEVSIGEEEKFEKGEFLTVEELKEKSNEMESWSELVVGSF
jgi:predicted NUDIX family phosphoesterase